MEETVSAKNIEILIYKAHCFSWGFLGCMAMMLFVEYWTTGKQTTLLAAVACGFFVTTCGPFRHTKFTTGEG